MLLTKPLARQVIQLNIPLDPPLPTFLWDTGALFPDAPMAPRWDHTLTQLSICLDISGVSTKSFSAVTMRVGIRIWEGEQETAGPGGGHRAPFSHATLG